MRVPGPLLAALAAPLLAACPAPEAPPPPADEPPPGVRPGVEVLAESPPRVLEGRRVGLITNHTGRTREGTSTIDVLDRLEGVELVALFAPEHGIRGEAAPGERVDDETDEATGLPIHSLYGETRAPTPEMLAGVEALVFDIQDVGARQYTYVYTMALAMEAAAEHGLPFVVLDRPNPIRGDLVEGGVLDPDFATFVGLYPIASRHGMTAGELAGMFNETFGIGADLTVVEADGWQREMWFDDAGLAWLAPSPNLPTLESAIHYPGTVYLEGTNLSEGRGTDRPFEQAGAPWLDAEALVRELEGADLPGVRFEVRQLEVDAGAGKFPGQTIPGVRLVPTDRDAYRPVETALELIGVVRRLHPDRLEWHVSHFDRLAGTDRLRLALEADDLPTLLAAWEQEAEAFRLAREEFLRYR